MIRLFRYLFLPTAAFVIIAGLAWGEWSKLLKLKHMAQVFHQNSEIRIFTDGGEMQWRGRAFPTYKYELAGETKEFPTHSRINLPLDGRVRMGLDPFPQPSSPMTEAPNRELVVPLNGPDSIETMYKGLRGHEIGEDITKASVVSVAAVIAGVAGFFLQRTIFRSVGRAYRSGR